MKVTFELPDKKNRIETRLFKLKHDYHGDNLCMMCGSKIGTNYHHVMPNTKVGTISEVMSTSGHYGRPEWMSDEEWSRWQKMSCGERGRTEIKKCGWVCHECHRLLEHFTREINKAHKRIDNVPSYDENGERTLF